MVLFWFLNLLIAALAEHMRALELDRLRFLFNDWTFQCSFSSFLICNISCQFENFHKSSLPLWTKAFEFVCRNFLVLEIISDFPEFFSIKYYFYSLQGCLILIFSHAWVSAYMWFASFWDYLWLFSWIKLLIDSIKIGKLIWKSLSLQCST